eukprot:TRINITY_DN1165_c0_g1_i1.p1 TRINITY_DN1165_c0_g1~~TRINITY_DN1165_c0_g1_i1.p1  ORF type:complete len:492 (+),score=115.96 TRINITY_DN1165_c0_g1_i1:62-1477(+)
MPEAPPATFRFDVWVSHLVGLKVYRWATKPRLRFLLDGRLSVAVAPAPGAGTGVRCASRAAAGGGSDEQRVPFAAAGTVTFSAPLQALRQSLPLPVECVLVDAGRPQHVIAASRALTAPLGDDTTAPAKFTAVLHGVKRREVCVVCCELRIVLLEVPSNPVAVPAASPKRVRRPAKKIAAAAASPPRPRRQQLHAEVPPVDVTTPTAEDPLPALQEALVLLRPALASCELLAGQPLGTLGSLTPSGRELMCEQQVFATQLLTAARLIRTPLAALAAACAGATAVTAAAASPACAPEPLPKRTPPAPDPPQHSPQRPPTGAARQVVANDTHDESFAIESGDDAQKAASPSTAVRGTVRRAIRNDTHDESFAIESDGAAESPQKQVPEVSGVRGTTGKALANDTHDESFFIADDADDPMVETPPASPIRPEEAGPDPAELEKPPGWVQDRAAEIDAKEKAQPPPTAASVDTAK